MQSQEDTHSRWSVFSPLAKLLLWAIRPHPNELLVGNEMGFVLLQDNIKWGKTEIITCCLIKILFSRAQHGADRRHFCSSQPTFGSCFITSQKKPVRAESWLLLSRKPDCFLRPFRGGPVLVAEANAIYPAIEDSYFPMSSCAPI